MPVTEMLLEGLRLMLIGMGIVFAFLLTLVAVLRLMSRFVKRFAPEPHAAAPVGPLTPPGPAEPLGQGELVAVLAAAVCRYRKEHRSG
jgi:oxaloacetate decarboxylase gamma subunit